MAGAWDRAEAAPAARSRPDASVSDHAGKAERNTPSVAGPPAVPPPDQAADSRFVVRRA